MNKLALVFMVLVLAGCGPNIEVAIVDGENLKPSRYKCRLGVLYVAHRNGITIASDKSGSVISCGTTIMTRGEVKDAGLWY